MLIVMNTSEPRTREAALILGAYLSELGLTYRTTDSWGLVDDSTLTSGPDPEPQEYLMAVVLGGDGTILRVASYLQGSATPLLGINFGHLGFLSNPADDGVVPIVAAALAGDVTEECRTNVRIEPDFGEEAREVPAGMRRRTSLFALNEMTLERGSSGRVVDVSVYVSGTLAYKTRGDGVVVASATGSTAYALSAGGPLIAPGNRGLVVVPIAAHTLSSRAMVTQPGDVVELVLTDDEYHNDVTMCLDGRPISFDAPFQSVRIRTGETPTRLLRYKYEGFYADVSRVFFREGGQE